jgi:UTP--glucose-1-phosphate uridylyltransferase
MPTPVKKAVFPVAGLGTRFLPATKAVPKEMIPVVDMPVIQYAVEEAKAAGIEEFVFVTSRGKTPIEDHFDQIPELYDTLKGRGKDAQLEEARGCELPTGRYAFVRQAEPLGLGHAVWCARQVIGDAPFAVLLPDEVFLAEPSLLAQMIAVYEEKGGNLIATREVDPELTARYGILETGHDDGRTAEVTGMVEKPKPEEAPSNLSVVGRYILQPEVFDWLEKFETGAGGEIQLTDAMARLIGNQPFHAVRFEGDRYDCGDKAGFVIANLAAALRRPDMADKVRAAARDLLKD